MYDSKFYGYVVSTALKQKEEEKPQAADIDFRKKGICGIINYLYSTNPNKRYYGKQ